MSEVKNPITMIADVEITQKLRVKIKSGTTTSPPEVEIAGVGERGIGINAYLVAPDKNAAINTFNKSGSMEMVADGAISIGVNVYAAAAGKISATAVGDPIGKSVESATADGDIIEVIPYVAEGRSENVQGGTIAVTGNTDEYLIAPVSGKLTGIDFSGIDALAANDTNYITFSVINMGQAGSGSTAMLAATDINTTKATGGSALAANTKRSLTLHGTPANLDVVVGDRLRIRAAATGTLASTVTKPVYLLQFEE